jgi:hypothetical protein
MGYHGDATAVSAAFMKKCRRTERMSIADYSFRTGMHPEVASLVAVVAEAGVASSETGESVDEAMLLGIGGGIGAGYILWEFDKHNRRVLVLGMRNKWQYAESLPKKVEERLNLRFAMAESAGAKSAEKALDATLASERPAMLWVDRAHLPWFHMPMEMQGCFGHTIVAFAADGERVAVDDRSERPFVITRSELSAARGRIPSYKNRLLSVESTAGFDLAEAVAVGLRDCADHLAQPSDSFSLPAIRKWARLMTDGRHVKGWPRVFADRKGLFSALVSVFDGVSDYGVGGGSLRGLYASFLARAAGITATPELADVATQYIWLANRWANLGEVALPNRCEPLARAKELIARRHLVHVMEGAEGIGELTAIDDELNLLREHCDDEFPLSESETMHCFEEMQAVLQEIFEFEVQANSSLRIALGIAAD